MRPIYAPALAWSIAPELALTLVLSSAYLSPMNESSFSLAWPDAPSRVRDIAVRTLRAAFTVFVLDGLYVR